MNTKKNTYISLFSSAGVGCYGFKQENFNCVATVELLEERINVQKANYKCKYDSGYIQGDLTKKSTKNSIIKEINFWKNQENIKDIDFVIATPPCQSMSTLNQKKDQIRKIVKNSLVIESVKLINRIKPNAFVIENTRTFLNTNCYEEKQGNMKIGNYIDTNLNDYNIIKKVINFKDYGTNSSRPRSLVIGTLKSIKNINPYFLWPEKFSPKIVREIISKKKVLNSMNEYDYQDPLHRFREYDERMLSWIKNTKAGQSAFENLNPKHRPHRIINGQRVFNKNKMTNKYKRTIPDNVMPCIHTRNDSLASQYTIHPYENRVFSIRELMEFMCIPKSFEWSNLKFKKLKTMDKIDIWNWYKKNELNIRRTIGESVPTNIFRNIAKRYNYIKSNSHPLYKIVKFEKNNSNKNRLDAYYTYPSIAFDMLKNLPFKNVKKILEPCAGAGLLTLSIIEWIKFHDISPKLYLNDIDKKAVIKLRKNIIYENKIISNKDFLSFNKKVDLLIMNPPYTAGKINLYNNLWEAFIGKANEIAKFTSAIIPKTFLNNDKISNTRKKLIKKGIFYIKDNGIHAFDEVYLETVILNFGKHNKKVIIESWQSQKRETKLSSIILGSMLLIYKDKKFNNFYKNLQINIFDFYRDRQISKKDFITNGIRVLKSKNIGKWSIINKEGYDKYVNLSKYKIFNYLNKECYMIPNFTYNIRIAKKPKNTVADGGVILLLKKYSNIKDKDLKIINTDDYKDYYAVLMNKSKFTININNEIIKYIGV